MASGMASGWLLANRSQRANLRLGPVPVESGEHLLSNTRLGKVTVDVLGDRHSCMSKVSGDGVNTRPGFDELRGEGVPEGVDRTVGDPGSLLDPRE